MNFQEDCNQGRTKRFGTIANVRAFLLKQNEEHNILALRRMVTHLTVSELKQFLINAGVTNVDKVSKRIDVCGLVAEITKTFTVQNYQKGFGIGFSLQSRTLLDLFLFTMTDLSKEKRKKILVAADEIVSNKNVETNLAFLNIPKAPDIYIEIISSMLG